MTTFEWSQEWSSLTVVIQYKFKIIHVIKRLKNVKEQRSCKMRQAFKLFFGFSCNRPHSMFLELTCCEIIVVPDYIKYFELKLYFNWIMR